MSKEITTTDVKDVLLKLFVNTINDSTVSELKALALDFLLNPMVHQDKLDVEFIKVKETYVGSHKLENIEKFVKNNNLQNVDIDETLKQMQEKGTEYISLIDTYVVVNVDIFRKNKFACANLRTNEIIYVNDITNQEISSRNASVIYSEPKAIEFEKSVEVDLDEKFVP